jgi:hypothetical protein
MAHEMTVRVETGATAFEFNPWLMRATVRAVRDVVPDVTKIEVYRDGGLIATLDGFVDTLESDTAMEFSDEEKIALTRLSRALDDTGTDKDIPAVLK